MYPKLSIAHLSVTKAQEELNYDLSHAVVVIPLIYSAIRFNRLGRSENPGFASTFTSKCALTFIHDKCKRGIKNGMKKIESSITGFMKMLNYGI